MTISLNLKLLKALEEAKPGTAHEQKLKHLIAADYEREIAKQNYRIWHSAVTANHGKRSKIKFKPYILKHDPSGFWSLTQIPLKLNTSFEPLPYSLPSSPANDMGLAVCLSEKSPATPSLQPTSKTRVRGLKGITSLSKRYLVGASKLLQSRYGRNSLAFHTATLPTDKTEIKIKALERSRHILKYFRKLLSNLLSSKGLDKDRIVIAMELQERNAIHFHSVFQFGTNGWDWKLTYEELDKIWKQAIVCNLPELKNADFSKACRTERIRKCVGRYLAKYLSKDISKQVPKEWNIKTSITWYSIGNELKSEFNSKIERTQIELEEWNAIELKETLEKEKASFCIKIVVIDGYGVRGINGYSDYPDFLDYLTEKLLL